MEDVNWDAPPTTHTPPLPEERVPADRALYRRIAGAQNERILNTTSSWGAPTWTTIFCYGLEFPESPTAEDRETATEVMQRFVPTLLVCNVCRFHFREISKTVAPYTTSRYALMRWIIGVHNKVNMLHGKPQLTVEQVLTHYTRLKEASITFSAVLRGEHRLPPAPHAATTAEESDQQADTAATWRLVAVILGVVLLIVLIVVVYYYFGSSPKVAPAARVGAPWRSSLAAR